MTGEEKEGRREGNRQQALVGRRKKERLKQNKASQDNGDMR